MMRRAGGGFVLTLACFLVLVSLLDPTSSRGEEGRKMMLIEDFTREDGRSARGTEWQAFTDRVMGGVSRGAAARDTVAGRRCMRLQGEVSLENNGGFIQVALPLRQDGQALDASEFAGIRLTVRGNGEGYFVHLRTRDTRLPWQYYQAGFATEGEWRDIDIPFTAFRAESLRSPLDRSRLERLGIVAAKKAFTADVAVARIALYK